MSSAADAVFLDEQLVARTRAGDRDAFRRIVERYQNLICSVAYSATGDLAQSEDLAQETFLAGWKQIAQLREPAKLRSWLCGIARNLANNHRRRLAAQLEQQEQPAAEHTDQQLIAPEPSPGEAAIKREQEAILWQAFERIPEDYRQPLILFYREQRSIAIVARDLELSEDAVRQRLSRGRKLLHREVLALVEGTLARTAPGPMFTTSVMATLPLLAATGVTTGTGGVAAQWTGAGLGSKLLLAFNLVVGPLIGIAAAWLGVRDSLREMESADERRRVKRYYVMIGAGTVLFTLASIPLNAWAKTDGGLNPVPMLLWLALLLLNVVGVVILAARLARKQTRENGIASPRIHPAPRAALVREYRSRRTLLGLPLLHVRLAARSDEMARPAVGWIAIGNCAYGLLFAWGGIAVGLVSGGGIAAGVVSIAAISLGGFAIGGLAVGVCAIGGVAVGAIAAGAFSFGWIAAEGRYAIAQEFAVGLHAAATHANDTVARQFFAERPWIDLRTSIGQAVLSLVWLPAVFVVWHSLHRSRRT